LRLSFFLKECKSIDKNASIIRDIRNKTFFEESKNIQSTFTGQFYEAIVGKDTYNK